MATTSTPPRTSDTRARSNLQHLAVAIAAMIAVLYGLLFAGVLTIPGATTQELGILGVAGAVHAGLAGLLWWRRGRLLWAGTALLQVVLAGMYLAIAPDRDPAFEVWGLTVRVVSLVLIVTLIRLIATAGRADRPDGAGPTR